MNEIRFLLDENVDSKFRTAMIQQQPEMIVWKIGDPGVSAKGTKDPEVLDWCEENNFILITNNRKSMHQHLADHLARGKHVPGILELNPNMSFRESLNELFLIWGASNPNEYQNTILYLPLL